MHPGTVAESDPDRRAVVMGASGEVVTYRALDEGSIKFARLLRDTGLGVGDHFAVMAENHPLYFELVWAALRSGLYVTAVNSHLTAEEASYIVDDCEAKLLVTSASLAERAHVIASRTPGVRRRLMIGGLGGLGGLGGIGGLGGALPGYEPYEEARDSYPSDPLERETRGTVMLYSSGTTGRPKGVRFPLPPDDAGIGESEIAENSRVRYGFTEEMVFLNPAPLYHSAPLRVSLAVHSVGGTVVVMERFDPELALGLIERERVTHSQWVPTMFVRMLKLPAGTRSSYDLTSHRVAVHAAAPCPVAIKAQMIEWWGPILEEYYAGTENIGSTGISSVEWLAHRGSVGRATHGAVVHVCDDEGAELPVGETGTVYFEQQGAGFEQQGAGFEYHGDRHKTAEVSHPAHPTWRTLGDVGRIDEDGYLYLTDRKAFVIVSGGVNIYPQEIEEALLAHPRVLDAAVIGVPDEEMGEAVKAFVEPLDHDFAPGAGDELERELRAWCADRLAGYKQPRSWELVKELPRLDNGKLYKRALRDPYWEGHESKVV